MLDGLKRLLGVSTAEEGIIPPHEIAGRAPGSYTVYVRSVRELEEGEVPGDVTAEFTYREPGHRPKGKGWQGGGR